MLDGGNDDLSRPFYMLVLWDRFKIGPTSAACPGDA